MTEDQIKHLVDRFLGWRLPENFSPDAGISFKRLWRDRHDHNGNVVYDGDSWPMPTGTNLFDATQADAMVRHMVDGLDSGVAQSPPAPSGPCFELADDETGGPCFFWKNPWSGEREKIANLWWPAHPVEATAEVEELFAKLELRVAGDPSEIERWKAVARTEAAGRERMAKLAADRFAALSSTHGGGK